MGNKDLRRRCQELVESLDIPDPFDVHELARLLGQRRARTIHLIPVHLPAGCPCGVWVATSDFDAVFYEAGTSPAHQQHIIGHELGHLLCEHRGAAAIDADVFGLLLPDLDPKLVQRTLARTNYSAVEERQAEMIASLISRAANRRGPGSRWVAPPNLADVFARLSDTLERRHRGAPHA